MFILPTANISYAQNLLPSVEQIDNYEVKINIQQSGEIYVRERIEYNFGLAQRHGIYRTIPYKYKNDFGRFNLRINDIAVTMDGQEEPAAVSRSGGEVEIKIGDPGITLTGKHVYNISYSVGRAINFFDDHDELYWNAIGTNWTVPILKSSVLLTAPATVVRVECFVGATNSQNTGCVKQGQNSSLPQFIYDQPLQPAGGFTIVAAMPAGTIAKPTTTQKILDIIRDNGIVALPVIVFVIMFLVWRRFGRDGKGRGTIIPQYDPPENLTPLYMGTLLDGKLDNRDFSAELIYAATQGYVKIEKIETKTLLWFKGSDYKITKLKEIDSNLPTPTQDFLKSLFEYPGIYKKFDKVMFGSKQAPVAPTTEVVLSSLRKNTIFSSMVSSIPKEVFKDLTRLGYYKYNPTTATGVLVFFGIMGLFVASMFLLAIFGIIGLISGIVTSVILVVFGLLMPAPTKKGAEIKEYILGLKQYMNVAEKDRLAFHNAPEKKPERFELLLPFAIALGVEKQWAKQFEGIYNKQPGWYTDSTGSGFNAAILSSSIGDFSTSMQSAVSSVTTSASGGSGFSGGGSGGGGGGGGGSSW